MLGVHTGTGANYQNRSLEAKAAALVCGRSRYVLLSRHVPGDRALDSENCRCKCIEGLYEKPQTGLTSLPFSTAFGEAAP